MLFSHEHMLAYGPPLLLVGFVAAIAAKVYSALFGQLSHLPGPAVSKWTDLYLKYKTVKGERVRYVHALHEKYGPVVRIAPHETSVADVDAARALYKIGTPFRKTPWYQAFGGDATEGKSGLFSTIEPKVHQKQRSLMSFTYSEKSISEMEDQIAANVQLAIRRMKDDCDRKGYVDTYRWFFRMATDVVGDAAFGESFQTLQKPNEGDQYLSDLQLMGHFGILNAEFPMLNKFISYLPFIANGDVVKGRQRISKYASESVGRYYKAYQEDPENVKPTLLSRVFKLVEDGTMEYSQLQRHGVSNLIAGSDTTSNTLTYATYLLTQNPEFEKELIAEVARLPEGFMDRDLKDCQLLNGIIWETLRLRPSVGQALPREVPAEGVTFCGHYLPGGSIVGIQSHTMHRLPQAWDQPEVYNPRRWEQPTKDMKHSFLPFGAGSRICIGMHLAELEMRHTLANFYRTFPTGMKASQAGGFSEADMTQCSWFLQSPKGGRCLLERK